MMLSLLRSLTKKYDYVLIDTPSVGYSAEMMSLKQIVQGALLVIRHDAYPVADIRGAISRLEKSGIRIIGVVVNQVSTLWKKPIDRPHTLYSSAPRRQTDLTLNEMQSKDEGLETSKLPTDAPDIEADTAQPHDI